MQTRTRFITIVLATIIAISGQTAAQTPKNLSKAEVKKLVATASTPADHRRLAAYFKTEAVRLEDDAKEHEELAAEYGKNPSAQSMKMPMSPRSAEHCNYFAKSAREAAKAARDLATEHEEMAKAVAKK